MLSDLYAYLAADTGIGAIVAVQPENNLRAIYPHVVKEATPLPALSFQVIARSQDYDLDGDPILLQKPRVQIDCRAKHYLECDQLAQAVRNAMSALKDRQMGSTFVELAVLENEIDDFEADRLEYGKSLDFILHHH